MKTCSRTLVEIVFWVVAFSSEGFAQKQPIVPEGPQEAAQASEGDPLREAALSQEFQEVAKTPLPPLTAETATEWRKTLTPVFESFDENPLPIRTVEEAAYSFLRARFRLTTSERKSPEETFYLMQDRERSPDKYWGKPVSLHGHLKNLQELPGAQDGGDASPWYSGELKLFNLDKTVRFVTRSLPEGFPTGNSAGVPVSVIGDFFALRSAEDENAVEPLIVARWVRWLKPALEEDLFAEVEDVTIGIQNEGEANAYYRTLLQAKLIDETAQKELAEAFWEKRQARLERPRPLFVDLFKSLDSEPSIYRGKPITLSGTLRELKKWEEMKGSADDVNAYGLETLYEGWIFAEDSQSNPTVVVFTENPDNLPVGADLNIPVRVTGYVFKMYGYKSQDPENPLRKAPMLLAKDIEKRNVPEAASFPMIWLATALVVLGLAIGLYVWSSSRKDKQFREEHLRKEEEDEPPQFDKLDLE